MGFRRIPSSMSHAAPTKRPEPRHSISGADRLQNTLKIIRGIVFDRYRSALHVTANFNLCAEALDKKLAQREKIGFEGIGDRAFGVLAALADSARSMSLALA